MKNLRLIVLFLIVICFTSCYSYKIPKEYRKLENNTSKRMVYIVNPSLKKELAILSNSELFTITKDSSNVDLKIKLYPIKEQHYPGCYGGLLSTITIGQIPVTFTNFYSYRFDEIEKGKTTQRKLDFKIKRRVWFWDMFSFNKRFEKKTGKMVLAEYQKI
ncbi:hypothetical protein [Flavobacterium phycosphaerae]|uniref:hypothetical protein n=1 Tax=Flavobacterium phycosphaerae TaxID=2697515 RepID=UPI00138B0337|nr:hypothetical protein [Flavobacterium phycosphaerae]